MVSAHSLATSIRSATENETFDLGGQNLSTITTIITAAFKEPFPLSATDDDDGMIRITFVTGAGKQARSKYDDGAAKAVTSTLEGFGYVEDRGASCVRECGGSYKLQHDTGKNLKTVVVFPMVSEQVGGNGSGGGVGETEVEAIVPEDSPGYKLAVSSMNVFKNMVKAKCPSWSQKKGCLGCIEALKGLITEFDGKLIKGVPLDDAEQRFYNAVVDLDEKEAHVRQDLGHMVEKGHVTAFERDLLLENNAEKIALLKKEKKPLGKVLQRKELLESIEPIRPYGLKYEAEIGKLHKELSPLLKLEEAAKGRLLTVKETQILAPKEEMLEDIAYFEQASRGWFEDDSAFESRLLASRQKFIDRRNAKVAKAATSRSSVGKGQTSVNKFYTPWDDKGRSKTRTKKKVKVKGDGVFAAMMMDSDDDDDDDDDDHTEQQQAEEKVTIERRSPSKKDPVDDVVEPITTSETPKKKSKKKKKKGKAKQQKNQNTETPSDLAQKKAATTPGTTTDQQRDENRNRETSSNHQSENETEEETAIAQERNGLVPLIISFICWIVPILFSLIISFLGWIITLIFGKPKKKRR